MDKSASVEAYESNGEDPVHGWNNSNSKLSKTGFAEESQKNGFTLFLSSLP